MELKKLIVYGTSSLIYDNVVFVYRPEVNRAYVCKVKPILHEVMEYGRMNRAVKIEPEFCFVIDLNNKTVSEVNDRDEMKWITQLALANASETIERVKEQTDEIIEDLLEKLGIHELRKKLRELLEKSMFYFKTS